MKATCDAGEIVLRMSADEATVLYECIAFSEWAEDLTVVELASKVEQRVFSDVQQSLSPLVPGLGTASYGTHLKLARTRLADDRHE